MTISSIVVKVASRCNLNCSYCYMYNQGDNSHKNQPKCISNEICDHLITRINNHCLKHNLKRFEITFHGGEPLLLDPTFYSNFTEKCKINISQKTIVGFSVQTNGTLVTKEWCELFEKLNIRPGFSLDGTKEAHDMFRVDHKGKGSYDDAVRGLNIYQAHNHNSGGVLSVLNIHSDPVEIYNHFKKNNVQRFNILIPDINYVTKESNNFDENADPEKYGDWLIRLFDCWIEDEQKNKPVIGNFDSIINLIIGRSEYGSEIIGTLKNDVLVIETDGGIEATDPLKTCGNNFTKEELNVSRNEFDEALNANLINLYYNSHKFMSKKCRTCLISDICGGGYLPHRYSHDNGFNNPSIYCNGLMKLITHIQNKVFDLLPQDVITEANMEKLPFHQLQEFVKQNINSVEYEDSKVDFLLETFSKKESLHI